MRCRLLISILVLVTCVGQLDAQYRVRFTMTYGGTYADEARDVEVTGDGSIGFAG